MLLGRGEALEPKSVAQINVFLESFEDVKCCIRAIRYITFHQCKLNSLTEIFQNLKSLSGILQGFKYASDFCNGAAEMWKSLLVFIITHQCQRNFYSFLFR